MILTKTIKIKTNCHNVNWYKQKGYNALINKSLTVKTIDLSHGSSYKIKVKCDICAKEKYLTYNKYIKNSKKYNIYTCSEKCAQIKNKKTNLSKYGNEFHLQSYEIKKKAEDSIFKKLGVTNPVFSDSFREKMMLSFRKKYNAKSPSHVADFFEKQQKNSALIKFHENTGLYYRGSYERDFLDFCYNNKIKIEKGHKIFYYLKRQKKVYHSDFYIPTINLIAEIKSNYTYNKDLEKNLLKKKYSIKSGYDFMFIIDKNYSWFTKLLGEAHPSINA